MSPYGESENSGRIILLTILKIWISVDMLLIDFFSHYDLYHTSSRGFPVPKLLQNYRYGMVDRCYHCCCRARVTHQQMNGHPPLQWRHNERDGVSNHQRLHCLPNFWFRRRSKKALKLRVTGLCAGNSPVTGEFPAQKVSNAENVSTWWRHHLVSVAYWAAGLSVNPNCSSLG